MAGLSWGRMNCQASRFVYHHDLRIFIDYNQRDWLRQRTAWGGTKLDCYPVALGQSLAGFRLLAIDLNVALLN